MPRSRWRASSPPTRPSSGGSCAASSGRSSGSSRRATPTPEELAGNEINAGLYAFDAAWLRRRIASLAPSAATGELYLTDLIRLAREDGRIVSAVAFEDDGRFDGINDRSQLAAAEWSLRVRLNEAHMRNGVTMRDPSTVYLDWTVELGAGRHARTERHPARRDERRRRQRDRRRQPAHRCDGRRQRARVWASIVESSTVEDEATVGPFSHLRPGSVVGRGAEVGNFAELKNTRLGAGLEAAPHELPRRRRGRRGGQHRRRARSPPTTTARRKHPTTIGDGAFIGVDTMIVAPREIGEGARTGAGAVVTRDVPAGQAGGRRPGPDPRAAVQTRADEPVANRPTGRRRALAAR